MSITEGIKLAVVSEAEIKEIGKIIDKLGILGLRWCLEFFRKKGILIKEIAKKSGMSEIYVYQIKTGVRTNVTTEVKRKILMACYNLSPVVFKEFLLWFLDEFKRELEEILGQKLP